MRRVAIIPARGGSKRLPRKNILDFFGKPIIAWTIEAAQKTALFDSVVVSTEDDEIKNIAQQYGAEVDERANTLASDDARVVDVCVDFLEREDKQARPCDVLAVLYATAPLRTAEDIQQTVGLILPDRCNFALATTTYDLPVHQALKLDHDHLVMPLWPDLVNKRAAEIGEVVVDNGSTYAVYAPAFLKEKTFYGEGLRTHLMPRARSQDIDEAQDLELARFYAQKAGFGGAV